MTKQKASSRGSVRARNRAAILGSAKALLTRDPGASMDDIAAAAGVVRRTVYGHFANRTELLTALVRSTVEDFLGIAGDSDRSEVPADEAMAAVVLQIWAAARAAWPLVALSKKALPEEVQRGMRPFHRRVAGILARGQVDGAFATHLAPDALARLVDAIAFAFLEARADGAWTGDERDVAVAVLIALGVRQPDAEAAVARSDARREPSSVRPEA
jgi:AcrR family transcriptional regulator